MTADEANKEMTIIEKINKLYNSETNFKIESFWDRGIEFMLPHHTGGANDVCWVTVYLGHDFEEGLNLMLDALKQGKSK